MRRFICYNSIIAERDAGMLPERMDTSCWMGRSCAPFRAKSAPDSSEALCSLLGFTGCQVGILAHPVKFERN